MSIQLRPDEALEVIERIGNADSFQYYRTRLEQLTGEMGIYITDHTPTTCGRATFEGLAFGGLCVPIGPLRENQPIPEVLQGIDDGGWH